MTAPIDAVLWDFGGVFTSSPFEAFARYETANGIPVGFIRSVNSHNPNDNAWARLERGDIGEAEFDEAFAAESAALGHRVPGADVRALLAGTVRPAMVAALDAVRARGLRTACLTNNIAGERRPADHQAIIERFDRVVESSKVGSRKPQPEFYRLACDLLGVEPARCVFLDDLGINLKPAAAMGMRTIKVTDPAEALTELGAVLGLHLDPT